MKVNIECRTVRVPANLLIPGTYFRYKTDPTEEERRDNEHGILLKLETPDKAVNLYTGTIVTVLDLPYDIIKDVELRGWV